MSLHADLLKQAYFLARKEPQKTGSGQPPSLGIGFLLRSLSPSGR